MAEKVELRRRPDPGLAAPARPDPSRSRGPAPSPSHERSAAAPVIRVLLVDDDRWMRQAVAAFLGAADGVVVVGECADGAEVLATAADCQPDVVLMDVHMPVMSGLEATRLLADERPAVRVIIISAVRPDAGPGQASAAGAAGFVAKGSAPSALVEAIRAVAAGGTAWPEDGRPPAT